MKQRMSKRGNLFVISGPSGVGKGTVCRLLLERSDKVAFSVSATTRKPRCEDIEGVTYYFKSVPEFEEMINTGKFLEWAVYNGNYYGTPREAVEKKLDEGIDIILEIETQGALKVMQEKPEAVSVFIEPPDLEELHNRLKNRGTESPEEISQRIAAAEWELSQKDKYDYVVVNGDLNATVDLIENIMKSERKKV